MSKKTEFLTIETLSKSMYFFHRNYKKVVSFNIYHEGKVILNIDHGYIEIINDANSSAYLQKLTIQGKLKKYNEVDLYSKDNYFVKSNIIYRNGFDVYIHLSNINCHRIDTIELDHKLNITIYDTFEISEKAIDNKNCHLLSFQVKGNYRSRKTELSETIDDLLKVMNETNSYYFCHLNDNSIIQLIESGLVTINKEMLEKMRRNKKNKYNS
jgi:hypothetical protein